MFTPHVHCQDFYDKVVSRHTTGQEDLSFKYLPNDEEKIDSLSLCSYSKQLSSLPAINLSYCPFSTPYHLPCYTLNQQALYVWQKKKKKTIPSEPLFFIIKNELF